MVALALLWRAVSGEVGSHYASQQDFYRSQSNAGWQEMGRYTNPLDFPARIVAVETAQDGIRFVRPDGVPQDYSGFIGKDFKLVALQPDDRAKPAFVLLMARSRS
jgi:hypothetical protein